MSGPVVTVVATGGGVVRAELTRPGLDAATLAKLTAALEAAEADMSARVLVIASRQPGVFCTGMPLSGGTLPNEAADAQERLVELALRLARSSLVTVALVDGDAFAGGLALCAACDLLVAGPRARFRVTELHFGLLPALLLPVLARRIGHHRAVTMALTARTLDAWQAADAGLADHTGEEAESTLRQVLRALRRADPGATAALKEYANRLAPPDSFGPEHATRLFREHLARPGLRERLDELVRQGVLR
ncbi:enoyl-CoA hydratase-related protein [Streptomyces sp. NPDC048278]|uniref:enoyl-CoA hydratase-related protein n=1 Tax=Streptomyces sp. NPDC048278 TaxID=3155809 RepID=UPI00342A6588